MAEQETLHLEGIVEDVLFFNPDNGYIVIELDVQGTAVTVVGEFGAVEEGESLSLDGVYTTHPRFGPQFHASYCERKLPADAINIQKYLSSGAIKGIGPSLARKIVDAFGDRTLEIMEKEPTRLMEIRGISPRKCESISNEVKQIFALRTLMLFLQQYQIHSKYAMRCYQRWEDGAVDQIAANPYLLCTPGIDLEFQRADKMAAGMKFPPNAPQRILAGMTSVLSISANSGHTCLPMQKLQEKVCGLLGVTEEEFLTVFQHAKDDSAIKLYQKLNREYVYLPEYFVAERYIADRISVIQDFSAPEEKRDFSKMIATQEQEQGMEYATLQREAVNKALNFGVLILTGGPGTGKTTTLNGIISLYEQLNYRVMIAAPTGRAAARISDLTGYEASTIHRMLEVEYDMTGEMRFLHNEHNPLSCDVMVVDEMSMVDVLLFEKLLRALRLGCKLILVGDCDQLPSVGAGNLLRDMIDSGRVPVVELKEIFRQAQKSSIITNAHKIITGEYPDLMRKDSDCFFFQRFQADAVRDLVLELAEKRLPKAYDYSPMEDIQIITPSRKGNLGVLELNKCLQEALNPPDRHKLQMKSMLYTFREGDKVMQIKNNYDITWRKDGESGMGIFNGDIGYIRTLNLQTQEAVVEFDGRVATYTFDGMEQLELAYAVTVHKSQGSEFQVVILPLLGGFPKLYYRNLLYTAVTRAKKLLIFIGTQKVICDMVDNNRRANRYTCLKDMMEKQEKQEEIL